MKNLEDTILWQYKQSITLKRLLESVDHYIDPSEDIEKFYDFVWNVDTAEHWGLDIWGRIVNVPRLYLVENPATPSFGFRERIDKGFNQATFGDGTSGKSVQVRLDDKNYRKLILAKALLNVSTPTFPSINNALQVYFADVGEIHAIHSGTMEITIICNFEMTAFDKLMINNGNLVPRGSGIDWRFIENSATYFGFRDSVDVGFNQKPFKPHT